MICRNDGTEYRPIRGIGLYAGVLPGYVSHYWEDAPQTQALSPGCYFDATYHELLFSVTLLDTPQRFNGQTQYELQFGRLHHPCWDFHRGTWFYSVSYHRAVLYEDRGQGRMEDLEIPLHLRGESGPEWETLWDRAEPYCAGSRIFHAYLHGTSVNIGTLPWETQLYQRDPPADAGFRYLPIDVADPLSIPELELLILTKYNPTLAKEARQRGISIEHRYSGAPFQWT